MYGLLTALQIASASAISFLFVSMVASQGWLWRTHRFLVARI